MSGEIVKQVGALPVEWFAYHGLELVRGEGFPDFLGVPVDSGGELDGICDALTLADLPAHFIAHELMELEAGDDSELLEFCKRWGVPMYPARYGNGGKPTGEALRVIEATEAAGWAASGRYAVQASVIEARAALRALVDAWATVCAYMRGGEGSRALADALRLFDGTRPRVLGEIDPTGVRFVDEYDNLTEAVCLQVCELMADPAPWRSCPVCGRVFKYQRRAQGEGRSREGAVYCSQRCAHTAYMRRNRAAKSEQEGR